VEYLLKILEEKRPKYFIFENVKGILSEKFRDFYTSILDEIVRLGYDVDASVYNTKDYGIPHNRERVFFTGARDGELIFFRKPQPIKLEKHLGDLLEDKVDKKYFLTEKFLEWATGREGAFEGRFKIKSPESVANCLTTRGGGRITDNFIFQYPRGKNK
jgi:DNA (cytosine-5)-methyltransferase 1